MCVLDSFSKKPMLGRYEPSLVCPSPFIGSSTLCIENVKRNGVDEVGRDAGLARPQVKYQELIFLKDL